MAGGLAAVSAAGGTVFPARFEVASGWKSRHRLDSSSTQADTLYGFQNLFGALCGDLDETDGSENLDAADDRAGDSRFIGDAADEIAG